VWREIARVLKPGGRVAVFGPGAAQAAATGVAESVRHWWAAWPGRSGVGNGADAKEAGWGHRHEVKSAYIDGMVTGRTPLYQKITKELPAGEAK